MKKLILSVLGAASLCAGPVFAQAEGQGAYDDERGPQFGTAEWIHRYGPNAVPHPYTADGRPNPHYPYVAPVPRGLDRDSAAARRERERQREIAALREREMSLQREREREIALQRERDREIAFRRDRDRDGFAGRRDRDRDGDGIANRRDRHPDDPSRY